MLKFGIMVMPQHPRTDSPTKRFRETLQLTRLARDAGFDSIACGQHFLSPPYQNLQSIPLLARLAAESGSMDLILSIVLLPLYSPVGLAEDVASLDVISDGRVVFGLGLGYRDIEYEAFNTTRRDRTGRFLEALELIRRLWTEDEVSFAGQHFSLSGGTCTIRPVQKPHPPIWIAANHDSAVARAGRLGCAWLLNPHATLSTLERQMEVYTAALKEAKADPHQIFPSSRRCTWPPPGTKPCGSPSRISNPSIRPTPTGGRTRPCRARSRFGCRLKPWPTTVSSWAA